MNHGNGHRAPAGISPEVASAAGALPQPTRGDRWQPLRLGLLNVYRFDDEEFRFERGRLLLRGNNGTGKSRILALTLPFLLDGELAAHRLEPDQDQAKRPEWNLLLNRHDDRLGYTWLEVGRLDGGRPRYLTLGCGMRAVKGRAVADRWYFTTDRRVGEDLRLVGDAGQPLTRTRLEEAIGGRGHVHETAKAYRADVDRRLFGLGEHRYEALVDLLIQLRRPQLSRQLDETQLSTALSEALPPVPQGVLEDVAEAFRTLEGDRDEFASYTAAAAATREFLSAYRRYAAIAVRRRVKGVTTANSTYEATQRKLRTAESQREEAAARLDEVADHLQTAGEEAERADAEVRTLEASPAMDRARELEHARGEAALTQRLAQDAAGELARAEETVTEHGRRVADAAGDAQESRGEVQTTAGEAATAAAAAGLSRDHDRAVAGLSLPDVRDPEALGAARGAVEEAVGRRVAALSHLRELGAARVRAVGQLAETLTRVDAATTELDAAREDEHGATEARADALAEAVTAYRRWVSDAVEVVSAEPDDVAWELDAWSGGEDRSPLARVVEEAVAAARERLIRAGADLDRRRTETEQARGTVEAERERVATVRHLPPPAPHTRHLERRAARAGAPLWQLVDLADGVDPATAAGYEAALEASGLLDAWVTPDGRVLDAGDEDVAFVADGAAPAPGGGLAAVLRPAVDRGAPQATAVPDEVVAAVITRIGAAPGAGDTWVSGDGRFRIGPLQGAWRKPAAEHLGHAAREAARRRRLEELDAELRAFDAALDAVEEEARTLAVRAARLTAEAETAPTDIAIRDAEVRRAEAARHVVRQREKVGALEEQAAARRTAVEAATAAFERAAADLGLADRLDDLDAAADALASYRLAVERLWSAVNRHATLLDTLDRSLGDQRQAAEQRDRTAGRQQQLRTAAAAAASRRDTLEATVGAEVEQILARLEAARGRLVALADRLETLRGAREEAKVALGVADRDIEQFTAALADEEEGRGAAIARLAAAVRAGLLPVASTHLADVDEDPGGWSADRAVRTARRIDQVLDDVSLDEDAWSRTQRTILGHFTDLERELISRDLRPSGSFEDELFVVTTTVRGETRSMPALRDFLDDEVAHRQALLSAREREILENHLVGDVAAHLHALLRAGEEWVAEVNAELQRMPTSTGMRLRFAWQPRSDGPPGLKEARRRLLAHHAGWSPQQREEVGAFLQEQITLAREADDAGSWQQHLIDALDYRRWHAFVVERYQDGEWKPLTRRTHGTGSGGEKALALTIPQFAAAAAHYRSADPHAPRLIMLDEAFVGIDSAMRAKCMGLLEQFDLDLVMTSEREWCCYPTVPGIAIAQLATREGIDAVGISRWVWNGRERLRADAPQRPVL